MAECPPSPYGPCGLLAERADLECPEDYASKGIDLNDTAQSALFDRALVWASQRVWEVSGRRWSGCCEATIRPTRLVCAPGEFDRARRQVLGDWNPHPLLIRVPGPVTPVTYPLWGCQCATVCSCAAPLRLPWLPVRGVSDVQIDGATFADWVWIEGTNLVERTDGLPWPIADRHDTAIGAAVTFTHGVDLPDEGKMLTAKFAMQLAMRACDKPCQLADGVRVIERPGIAYGMLDPEYRNQNLTGYRPLDDWLVNALGGADRARTRPRLVAGRRQPRSLLLGGS